MERKDVLFHKNITTKVGAKRTKHIEFELDDSIISLDDLISFTLNEAIQAEGQQHGIDHDNQYIGENSDLSVNESSSITNEE